MFQHFIQMFLRRPTTYIYLSMTACFLLGQFCILSCKNLLCGILITLLGVFFLMISFIGDRKFMALARAWQPGLLALAKKVEQLVGETVKPRQTISDETQASEQTEFRKEMPGKEDIAEREFLSKQSRRKVDSWVPDLEQSIEFKLPRSVLIIIGSLLVVVSQPLLMIGKFIPALIFIIPGLALLVNSLLTNGYTVKLGQLKAALKAGVTGLLGLGLILAGHYYIWHFLEGNMAKEITGLLCNAAGIMLIYSLIPRVIPETEPLSIQPLDRFTGEAKTKISIGFKVGLIILSGILFYLAKHTVPVNTKTFLYLASMTGLALSFPWSCQKAETRPTPGLLLTMGIRLIRLLAFGLALYWAYKGQMLISHEQLCPGLYRFAVAGLALLVALREPDMREKVDPLQEEPLKWYWEMLGLIIVLGVGFWLRYYMLDAMPYGIECDEAGGAHEALDVLEGKFHSVTVHPCGRQLFMLLPKVVAFHFLGIGSMGVRFASVVWGVLTILLMYLMGRHFFGARIALAVSALFAVSRWHIHFSRYGWSNTLMVLLIVAGYYFVVKGLSSRRKAYFFWAGIAFSLCVQTETAARLVPIICLGLLIYLCFTYKNFFFRYGKQMLALVLGVWIAGAGIYIFWINKPHKLLRRVHEVSIFAEDANAPRDVIKSFLMSAKLSLTQLNWHGDYRRRHNGGLSGEPVADRWTAILFVLGFAYSLYYWKRLRYFLPLLIFFGFMSASIFSLEAPQSHRAFGAIPAVFLLVGGLLDRSRRLLREVLGRPGAVLGALAFLVLLVPITKINYQKYFNAWPAFDTNCNAAARHMGSARWKDAYHKIMSAHLWMGHPPFKLYARGVDGQFYYQPSEVVPIRRKENQDVLYTFIIEYPPLIDVVKWFYPQGSYGEERHPKYGLQFQSWGVKQKEIARTRGLTAFYWNNTEWAGKPALVKKDYDLQLTFNRESWPLSGKGSVAWEGTIFIPHEGEYTFYCYGTDYLRVNLGKRVFLQAGNKHEIRKTIWMAGGLHKIRARAKHLKPESRILFAWSCSEDAKYYLHRSPYQKMFFKEPVPATHFFTYTEPIGLLETLYSNDNWEGIPARQAVEPIPFFMWHGSPHGYAPPLSANWRGWITIEKPGDYQFQMQHGGYGELVIAGQTVVRNGQAPGKQRNSIRSENPVYLTRGKHKVFIRWSTSRGWFFKFWWTTPGGKKEIVPAWILSPETEWQPR